MPKKEEHIEDEKMRAKDDTSGKRVEKHKKLSRVVKTRKKNEKFNIVSFIAAPSIKSQSTEVNKKIFMFSLTFSALVRSFIEFFGPKMSS